MREFLVGLRAAWPEDAPWIDGSRLRPVGLDGREIGYDGGDLRAPLHRGLVVHVCRQHPTEAEGRAAVGTLVELTTRHAAMADRLRRLSDRVETVLAGSGGRIASILPRRYAIDPEGGPRPWLEVEYSIEMIGRGLEREASPYLLGSGRRARLHMARLRRDVRSQDARRARSRRDIFVDHVLGWHLSAMPDKHLNALHDLLARSPKPTGEDAKRTLGPGWNARSLMYHGIPLAERIASVRVVEGRIVGGVRIADSISWNDGQLLLSRNPMPETMLAALPGRPVADLLRHPAMPPDTPITRAERGSDGRVRVNVDTTDMMVAFPIRLPRRHA